MLAFDEARHEYVVDARRVRHVTEVLPKQEGLLRASAYDVERKRQVGQAVHRLIQLDLHGTLDEASLDPELVPWLDAWREFRIVTRFEPVLVETRLYSRIHDVAGALDMGGYFRARLSARLREAFSIIDAKCTCAEPSPATGPQTAAYELLVDENHPELRVKERHALWLRPGERPAYRLVPYIDPNDRTTFLSFLRIARWRADNGYEVAA